MDKGDIRDLRRWFVNAARRSRVAGFDLVCLYGAHGFGIFQHFLSPGDQPAHRRIWRQPREPRRGSLNEVIERHPRRGRRHDAAITLRVSLDETIGDLGFSNAEVRDFIAMHADLPDLWDLAHGAWEDCSGPSRFKEEAAQETLVAGIKELTSKPVVGVGRFTSPDVMVAAGPAGRARLHRRARPSIADPFLPRKIEEGRVEDIRECIGCNICITGDMTMSISRCTQNPTFMEEWRKGWHPERMNPKGASANVLVVGAGPAGLEAARALGLRGYDVALAEAGDEARRAGGARAAAAGAVGLGAGARLPRVPALAAAERRDLFRQPARRRRDHGVRLRARRDRHRRALAARRRRPACTSCRCRSTRRCRSSRPTTSWTAACPRARSSSSTTTTTTWAGCSPSCWRRRAAR